MAPGELVGFLGPNGAGKITTLRMLTTLLTPTAGTATVAGCDLLTDPLGVRRRIGYVGQAGGTGPECQVLDELVLQGRFYGMSQRDAHRRGAELLGQLDLGGTEDRRTGSLSGGQRRRLDIAMGLMHVPGLLFLDEPTTGLDPQSRANLWQHIRALHAEHGTTLFLTTHYLDEADALCDRILVIDDGRIVAEGTPEELKSTVAGDTVALGTDAPARIAELAAAMAGASGVSVEGGVVSLRVPRASAALPVQLALFGTAFVGFALIGEYRNGVVERMRVTPVSRTALLLGRSSRDVMVLLVQGVLLICLAVPFGLRVPVAGVLLGLGLVALLGLAVSSASYALALRLKSEDVFAPVLNSIIVPVLLLSGILLPMSLAPGWLYTLSRFNPFVYVVDAERAAFVGDLGGVTVGLGVLAAAVLATLAVVFGARTFQRESA